MCVKFSTCTEGMKLSFLNIVNLVLAIRSRLLVIKAHNNLTVSKMVLLDSKRIIKNIFFN